MANLFLENLPKESENIFTKILTEPTTTEPVAPVSTLSTDSAVNTIDTGKQFLDKTYPVVTQPTQPTQPTTTSVPVAQPTPTAPTTTLPPTTTEVPKNQAVDGTVGTPLSMEEAVDLFGSDFTGLHQTADGTWIPDSTAWERAGITGVQDPTEKKVSGLEGEIGGLDDQLEDLVTQFNSYNVDSDPAFQAQAQSIRAQYEKLRSQMQKTNASRQSALETLGYRTGTSQFAGAIQMGIVGEEINQANDRLNEITRQESDAVSAARSAFESGQWTKFDRQVTMLQTLRENKSEELKRYNDKLAEANKQLQEQSKQELEVAKYLSDIDWKNAQLEMDRAKLNAPEKPITVSPGSTVYDPTTGQALFTAPERPSENKPIVEKIGNSLLQWNSTTGGWDNVYTATGSEEDNTPLSASDIKTYQELGYDVKPGMTKGDLNALSKLKQISGRQEQASTVVSYVNEIKNHPGKNSAVGINTYARGKLPITLPFGLGFELPYGIDYLTGKNSDFIGRVQQLVDTLTLAKLVEVKGQGATFGALSDSERAVIERAATPINQWVIKDKNGKVVGYKIDQRSFDEEIKRIESKYAELQGDKNPSQVLDEYGKSHPEMRQKILDAQRTINPSTSTYYTDDEVLQIYPEIGGVGFKGVGGDTNTAIVPVTIGNKVVKVSGQIKDRLARADADFFKATGQHIQINQHYRTRAEQEKLYKELSKKGARVAPPGKSFHEKGLAVDVTNWKEAEKYLRKYGLVNELADDKGHFSFGEFKTYA